MGKLSASAARSKKSTYIDALDTLNRKVQSNFEDMDFENANRRDEVEREIENIKNRIKSMRNSIDSIYFEE